MLKVAIQKARAINSTRSNTNCSLSLTQIQLKFVSFSQISSKVDSLNNCNVSTLGHTHRMVWDQEVEVTTNLDARWMEGLDRVRSSCKP